MSKPSPTGTRAYVSEDQFLRFRKKVFTELKVLRNGLDRFNQIVTAFNSSMVSMDKEIRRIREDISTLDADVETLTEAINKLQIAMKEKLERRRIETREEPKIPLKKKEEITRKEEKTWQENSSLS